MSEYRALNGAKPISTTVRPPLVPTFIATYAGANHNMCKRTPLHDLQKNAGVVFRRMGVLRRARYFSEDFLNNNIFAV